MTAATSITVRVPLKIRRRPGRKTVVMPTEGEASDGTIPTRADPTLVKALARAFRYQKLLDEGRYASVTEMAAAERIERGYLGSLLRLTLLAPDIVEAILDGQPAALGALPRLLQPLPVDWAEQCGVLVLEIGVLPVATDREGRTAAAVSRSRGVRFASHISRSSDQTRSPKPAVCGTSALATSEV